MDKKIMFYNLPKSFTSNKIESGCNGSCFLIDDNKVFKMIKDPIRIEHNINRLSRIYIPSFTFPQELVYVKNEFVGYIMDYVNGVTLEELTSVPLDAFIKHMRLFEYNIGELSLNKIRINDMNIGNIIYDENSGFKAIDTDFYYKDDDKDVYQNNLSCFSISVFETLLNIYKAYFINNNLQHKFQLLIDGKYLPSKFLVDILKEFRRVLKLNINNTYDTRETIDLILK